MSIQSRPVGRTCALLLSFGDTYWFSNSFLSYKSCIFIIHPVQLMIDISVNTWTMFIIICSKMWSDITTVSLVNVNILKCNFYSQYQYIKRSIHYNFQTHIFSKIFSFRLNNSLQMNEGVWGKLLNCNQFTRKTVGTYFWQVFSQNDTQHATVTSHTSTYAAKNMAKYIGKIHTVPSSSLSVTCMHGYLHEDQDMQVFIGSMRGEAVLLLQ